MSSHPTPDHPPHSKVIITIDGPAASGKGTIAYLLARRYGLINLDTGAYYRAATWLAVTHGVAIQADQADAIVALLKKFPLQVIPNPKEIGPKSVVLAGQQDITDHIRTSEISQVVAEVGDMPEVRQQIVALQRLAAAQHPKGAVVEGRDIGTVVFPQAPLKFFLTASTEVRAQRRHAEFVEKGYQIDFEQVYSDLVERDQKDSERSHSALKVAEGAILVDGTDLTIDQTVDVFAQHIDQYLVTN